MWQRFTERARRVIFFSQQEAKRLGYRQVNTEHLLFGLLRENEDAKLVDAEVWPPAPSVWRGRDSVAVRVLKAMETDSAAILALLEQQASFGAETVENDMQLTATSKHIIDCSYNEARRLKNDYIGTEHLLLGLIGEDKGIAGNVLSQVGVTLGRTREEVARLQGGEDGCRTPKQKVGWWNSLFSKQFSGSSSDRK